MIESDEDVAFWLSFTSDIHLWGNHSHSPFHCQNDMGWQDWRQDINLHKSNAVTANRA